MHHWGVSSEIGRLRWVLVHRPGREHRWTLPWNKDIFLFDDVLDVEEAREEHKGFTSQLANNEVAEVLFVTDLLRDICAEPSQAIDILNEIIGDEPEKEKIRELIESSEFRPHHLILGYPDVFPGFKESGEILLNPTPNLYFTRDPAFAVPGAVVISSPAREPRRREARLMRSLFRRHPKFKGFEVYDGILESWRPDMAEDEKPTIEGGDVHAADARTVLVGIGERTNEKGAQLLTNYLFAQTSVERVLKIKIPANREFMHLDTLMTFVDRKQILTLPYLWEEPDRCSYVYKKIWQQKDGLGAAGDDDQERLFKSSLEVVTKGAGGKQVQGETHKNVIEGLHHEGVIDAALTVYVAGRKDKYSSPEEHILAALREQWNDGANVLALKPGQVICYERNDRTQRGLEQAGLEVVTFRGGELVRGRGGARCMTMPLLREPI